MLSAVTQQCLPDDKLLMKIVLPLFVKGLELSFSLHCKQIGYRDSESSATMQIQSRSYIQCESKNPP